MRELVFRRQNKTKWQELEHLYKNRSSISADQLSEVYVEVMNDLSYASTYYPNSSTHEYLNDFANQLHHVIYKTKVERKSRIRQFWQYEVPLVVRKNHKFFFYSFLVFGFFVLLGAISQHVDPDYLRAVVGDGYVEMTINNIEKGDPMGVYKDENQFYMFIRIFLNNLLVGLRTVAAGIIPFLGPVYILFVNGVMLGSFIYFFVQQGVFVEAFSTVFIHGTIEILTIVVEGAASFIISKSILFPGTYRRIDSLIRGVKDAIKICVGAIPLIFIAAFFEGYVTRYTDMPTWLTVVIIGGSFLFMAWYYIIYPIRLDDRLDKAEDNPVLEVKDI